MYDSKCGSGKCTLVLIGKILLIVGGVNWGLVGVGMLMDTDLNVVHMLIGSLAYVEAVVYILVGVAAIMTIFGYKCKNCTNSCGSCAEGGENKV